MRPFVEAWKKAQAEVDLFVTTHERAPDASLSSSSSSSNESDDDEDEDEEATCNDCDPSSADG